MQSREKGEEEEKERGGECGNGREGGTDGGGGAKVADEAVDGACYHVSVVVDLHCAIHYAGRDLGA